MSRFLTALTILAVGATPATSSAGVVVAAQAAEVLATAGSHCVESSLANPDRAVFLSEEIGPVAQALPAAQASSCGAASANSAANLVYDGNVISGSIEVHGILDEVGVARSSAVITLDLVSDIAAPYRIEVRRSFESTGDDPELGAAFAGFSGGILSIEPDGLHVWEGNLEPGVTYEFFATGLVFRASLTLADGTVRLQDGESSGRVDFTITLPPGASVAQEDGSVGALKVSFRKNSG